MFGFRIVEEGSVGVVVITNKDGGDGLGDKGVVRFVCFDVGCREERDEFAPIRFDIMSSKERGGSGPCDCFDGHIILDLDGVVDGKEPKFTREKMIGEPTTSEFACVPPVNFAGAVFPH